MTLAPPGDDRSRFAPRASWGCRWCGGRSGEVVLDLGRQPAADRFPLVGATEPDPLHELRMVLCARCGLAQLEDDPTGAEEPRGVEPAALVEQAESAVADLVTAGCVTEGSRVTEYGSPHGGSWLGPVLAAVPRATVVETGTADLVIDSLGLMHEPDVRAAWERRVDRLATHGVLALHVHPLATIVRDGTWNALRHGHYAYFSLTVLVAMARSSGLVPVGLWHYPLYGGTQVLALARPGSRPAATAAAERVVAELTLDVRAGVCRAGSLRDLDRHVGASTTALRSWLDAQRGRVVGYGAASRAVTLFAAAGVTASDVEAVVDASPAKRGRAMPGAPGRRVPIVGLEELDRLRPDRVLLLVPDLLDEVRQACPQVEQHGGRWVVAEPEPRAVPPLTER